MGLGITFTSNEILQAGTGGPGATGRAFFAGEADQGPGTTYVRCASINDYTIAFGARSPTSATLYDAVDVFFHEGGSVCYVTRVNDATSIAATLTLSDVTPHPTVVVSALSPGVDGNAFKVAVALSTAATLTGNTASSITVTNVSSFANIGVGTPVSGTGIPAGTYVASVTPGSSTLTLSQAATATATGVTITPTKYTVTVQDSSGNILETHGPYNTTAQLFADTTSAFVAFSQSAGSGFTTNVPTTTAATALAGGGNITDITDTIRVGALANFPPALGPGTVAIPGQTSPTIWAGIGAHCVSTGVNRMGAVELPDTPTAATIIAAMTAINNSTYAGYLVVAGAQCIVPNPFATATSRTVGSSAVVAALRARVSATGNDNQAPSGVNYPLRYVTGFTNTYSLADTISLNAVGFNTFQTPKTGLGLPALCLCGFSSGVLQSADPIFWQASAGYERMALVNEGTGILNSHMFQSIDGRNLLIGKVTGELMAMIARHWSADALYGADATDAGKAILTPPINTTTTEQAGALNANVLVRISPFMQSGTYSLTSIPITSTIPA
jgi:hypothetical protein